MQILQLSPIDIYPPSRGGEHRTHGLVSAFAEEGDSVVRLAQGGLLANHELLSNEIMYKHRIDGNYIEFRPRNPLYDLVRIPLLFGVPGLLFISKDILFWNSDVVEDLFSWANIILVEGPWQIPAVLRAAPDAKVVYSSHNVEIDRDLVEGPQFLSNWTSQRVKKLESRAVQDSDAIICTSQSDVDRFDECYSHETPTIIAPNATYKHRLEASYDSSGIRERYGIASDSVLGVFLGSDYAPNNESAVQLAKLTPKITDLVPDFELVILGNCGGAIKDVPSNVTVAGYVNNIDTHLAAADVAFNPVTRGSGTNIKMFDYFVQGLPVITTPFGAQGIDVTHGEHAIVVELSSFPEWTHHLVNNPDSAESIGQKARKLVSEQYTWEHVSQSLRKTLMTILDFK